MARVTESKSKSRTFRRVKVRSINGTKTVFRRRKPAPAQCAVTGEKLQGVPRAHPLQMKNMAKSQKRPNRPFGGVLGSKASRVELKKRARNLKL